MAERSLQQALVEAARLLGYRVYHTWLSARSAPGFPDLILVRPPALLALECKSVRGRLTADQRAWLADLEACGVVAHVVRPQPADDALGLDDALALLARCAGQEAGAGGSALRRTEAFLDLDSGRISLVAAGGGYLLGVAATADTLDTELRLVVSPGDLRRIAAWLARIAREMGHASDTYP
jgi:hypothetical protein